MSLRSFQRHLLATATLALMAGTASAAIVNGSFELGNQDGSAQGWTDTDNLFGYSRCVVDTCGTGGNTSGPNAGNAWIWFGGAAQPQTAVLSQNTTIESTSNALLFDFWMGLTAGTASLTLTVDGQSLWSVTQADAASFSADFSTVSVALGALANGGVHQIRWSYQDGNANNNWSLDNVRLGVMTERLTPQAVPEPGSLALAGLAALALVATRRRRA